MSSFPKFIRLGVLDDYEISCIKRETDHIYSDDKNFKTSTVTANNNATEEDLLHIKQNIRSSISTFPNIEKLPETTLILEQLVKPIIKNIINIYLPTIQLLKYYENDFYNWHDDVLFDKDNKRCRIISVSINLSDDYVGGGLEVKYKDKIFSTDNTIGSYCIFPSFCTHRAISVTSGVRRALTLWFAGDGFALNKLHHEYDNEQL